MTRHVVVGVDGSGPAMAAVEWAAADAGRRGLELRVVHVCEQWPYGGAGTPCCAEALETAAARARELAPGIEVATRRLPGNAVEALIGESASADSVVLGSRGLGGFAGMVLGSVGLAVAGHAAGPVVIVRGPSAVRHGRVVVGHDGSGHAEAAMGYGVEQARARRVPLLVVHVPWTPAFSRYGYSPQQDVREAAERLEPWRARHPDVDIVDVRQAGHPVAVLAAAGAAADLLVVGSRGLGGFASAVLGSVSHGVLHHATCPVAVVRPRTGGA
ncbi:universal stress protein [Actinomadura sp. ATCC 31491]|uniref:Universal stress protein n=1 Tax=Actinomadura luzonensis TaxID=2805427 RepID=A0ABT0G123_9ACTN|nr:universal stress protein [Actinomadura luzonensis]MCK2218312.1 universal stress protein [Actinomadura luzonensis]